VTYKVKISWLKSLYVDKFLNPSDSTKDKNITLSLFTIISKPTDVRQVVGKINFEVMGLSYSNLLKYNDYYMYHTL
jgi:hypothetical protein